MSPVGHRARSLAGRCPPPGVGTAACENPPCTGLPRILSTALITPGLVVLADAGLTLVWQEPLSPPTARSSRARPRTSSTSSRRDFPSRRTWRRSARRRRTPRRRGSSPTASRAEVERATRSAGSRSTGSASTSSSSREPTPPRSRTAPGHYLKTSLPGQPGTVAIAGHRTTYLAPFRHINEIEDGDEIRRDALGRLHLRGQTARGRGPQRRRSSSRSATTSWCSPPATRSTAPASAGRCSRGSPRSTPSRSAARAWATP